MDGNALLPPPAIKAPTFLQRRRRRQLDQERVRLESRLVVLRREAASQRDRWEPHLAQELGSTGPPGDAQLVCGLNGSPRNQIGTGEPRVVGKLDWIAGRHQQAWRLDGSSFAEYPLVGDFEASDAFSFSAWVKIDSNDHMAALSKMQDDLHHRGYDLYLGKRKIYVHLIHHWDGDAIRVNTRLPIRKEKWQHICVTYDGSSRASGIKVFVDGISQELDVTHDQLSGSLKTDQAFRIGGRDESAPFRGAIDDVRVYRRELREKRSVALDQLQPAGGDIALPCSRSFRRTETES